MAKKKYEADDDDDDRRPSPVNVRHEASSHSNARAVQLVSGRNGTEMRNLLDESGTAARPRHASSLKLRPSVNLSPLENAYLQQPQTRSRHVVGLAGLIGRKLKKSWSGSESLNSSTEGTLSETCDSGGDWHRKKKKEKKSKPLRQRAGEVDARPEMDSIIVLSRTMPTATTDDQSSERRRRAKLLEKKASTKSSTEREAVSTASNDDSGNRRHDSTDDHSWHQSGGRAAINQPSRGRVSDRASSAKNTDRKMANDIFQATAVYRTGSGSILVQAEHSELHNSDYGTFRRRDGETSISTSRRQDGDRLKMNGTSAEKTVKMYPKYKADALVSGRFWTSGSGTHRTGLSDTEVKTARLPTVSTAYVNMDAYRSLEPTTQGHPQSTRDVAVVVSGASGLSSAVRGESSVDMSNVEPKSTGSNFVAGHYARIVTPETIIAEAQKTNADKNNSLANRMRSPIRRGGTTVGDVHRSKSPSNATQGANRRRQRHLSGNDIGRHRSASRIGRNSADLRNIAVDGQGLNDRQSKSADDLSPRVCRRDDGRDGRIASRRDNDATVDDSQASRPRKQPIAMRTVTIHVTGTKGSDQRDQFDHLREKTRQQSSDTLSDEDDHVDAQGRRSTANMSVSVPNLKKYGCRDDRHQTDQAGDNVYRPTNGNLPRADSTDSLMLLLRKDQYDFLSERNSKDQRETIDSVYWKGDSAKSETGLTVDLSQGTFFAAASSVNTTASLEMLLLSDEGGSECSSNSEPPSLKSETSRSQSADGKRWYDDTGSLYSSSSNSAVPWRPKIGSTGRLSFVRRSADRHSAREDLFGRYLEQVDDWPTAVVREAPCLKMGSTCGTQLQAFSPTVVQHADAEPHDTFTGHQVVQVVQPIVVHEYAEVISFFGCEKDGQGSGYVSEARTTGSWQWPMSDGARVVGVQDGRARDGKTTASGWADVVGRAVFHFRNVSICTDDGSRSELPIDTFRLVHGSMGPAGSRRAARMKTTVVTPKYEAKPWHRSPATESSDKCDGNEDDDGIVGYRRYLVTGSRATPAKYTSTYDTSSYTSGNSWTPGRLWRSVWPVAGSEGAKAGRPTSSFSSDYSRSLVQRPLSMREDNGLLATRLKLGINFCDYFAGMLLGMVTVLVISYLQCGD